MRPTRKRIIVDGVDFGQLFRFPMILRAVTASMQPPRLLVGVLLVLMLSIGGQAWDAITDADIAPGSLAGAASDQSGEMFVRQELRNAIRQYVPESEWPAGPETGWPLNPGRWFDRIESGYGAQSARWAETLPEPELERRREAYIDTMSRLRAFRPLGAYEATCRYLSASFLRIVRGTLALDATQAITGVREIVILPVALLRHQTAFALIFGVYTLLLCSIFGGALCRMSACQNAQQERLRVRDAFAYVKYCAGALITAPLLPLISIAVVSVAILVPGLLMTLPVLNVLGGVLYGFALILGFLLAFLLIGYAAGLPLLIPAVACENCSAGDAMQRAYAYVIQRPLHLACYLLMLLLGLVVGYAIVSFVATLALNFTADLYGAFAGDESPMAVVGNVGALDLQRPELGAVHQGWSDNTAVWFLRFWQGLVIVLVLAYIVAYLFASSTIMYLLIRRSCDGQDVDEIWQPGLTPGTLAPQATIPVRPEPAPDSEE
ncbi:MAG: hypothetical protein KC983_07520 [Phycisphaerales bacterium]|nr:hypothetical protein [Phycisphaerales bacterium]